MNMMKPVFKGLFLWLLVAVAMAQTGEGDTGGCRKDCPRLNKIQLQVSAEQWVTTKTAKVIVGVDASLDQGGLDKLQSDVIANLNKLAKDTQWRITTFDRNQEQSDLEKVHIEAEARLQEGGLTTLRAKAKELSKPGVKYSIIDIQYEPSLSEFEAVRNQLRQSLYKGVSDELASLNNMYPDQHYYVHQITFSSPSDQPTPQPMVRANLMMAKGTGADVSRSNNLVMVADVVVASSIANAK